MAQHFTGPLEYAEEQWRLNSPEAYKMEYLEGPIETTSAPRPRQRKTKREKTMKNPTPSGRAL